MGIGIYGHGHAHAHEHGHKHDGDTTRQHVAVPRVHVLKKRYETRQDEGDEHKPADSDAVPGRSSMLGFKTGPVRQMEKGNKTSVMAPDNTTTSRSKKTN